MHHQQTETGARIAARIAARIRREVVTPWTVHGIARPQPLAADMRATFERADWTEAQ